MRKHLSNETQDTLVNHMYCFFTTVYQCFDTRIVLVVAQSFFVYLANSNDIAWAGVVAF